jgi:NitT/TauT family transport system substrate-binding protein
MMINAILALALQIVISHSALAQPFKINVGYSGISGDHLPSWLAKEAGIFDRNGLDVQLVYVTGGTTTSMALISKDLPIIELSGSTVINSGLAGSDAAIVAAGFTSLSYALMGAPGITAPAQLRGGSVAVSRLGGAAHFTARFALEKLGLTPGKDVTFLQIGTTTDRLVALQTGRVQAAPLDAPIRFVAQKRGMNVLADVANLGLVIQHTCVATTRRYAKDQADIVKRYVRSQIEAVHRIYTDRETSIKVLSKYHGNAIERDLLEKTYESFLSEAVLPRKQYPSLEGIKTVLQVLGENDAKAKAAKPENFADLTFVRELDQSGYIDSLYKTKN